jgi:hypothetical protein
MLKKWKQIVIGQSNITQKKLKKKKVNAERANKWILALYDNLNNN